MPAPAPMRRASAWPTAWAASAKRDSSPDILVPRRLVRPWSSCEKTHGRTSRPWHRSLGRRSGDEGLVLPLRFREPGGTVELVQLFNVRPFVLRRDALQG